jgi:midasin (ATPase involved in ribosome maturation)
MAKLKEKITIKGVTVHLTDPVKLEIKWVGQEDVKNQLIAAWTVFDSSDYPMNPRLVGKPGVGKTTLAYSAAQSLNKPVYLFQATMDTRPEDLIITPVISENNKIKYMASAIVSAMINGGVVIIDEGNRMNERSWASLAPLLDKRGYVESVIAGIRIYADPEFRFVTTMNEDSSTYDLPEYILSRLQPKIFIDFPDKDDEYKILKENLPFITDDMASYIVTFLQNAHDKDLPYSVRDGINIGRFASKLIKFSNLKSVEALRLSFEKILGEDHSDE